LVFFLWYSFYSLSQRTSLVSLPDQSDILQSHCIPCLFRWLRSWNITVVLFYIFEYYSGCICENSVYLCNLFFGVLLLINSVGFFFFDITFTLFPKEPAWYVIINIDYTITDWYINIDYTITDCYINTDYTIRLLHQYRL
jgi:hypothetical protein